MLGSSSRVLGALVGAFFLMGATASWARKIDTNTGQVVVLDESSPSLGFVAREVRERRERGTLPSSRVPLARSSSVSELDLQGDPSDADLDSRSLINELLSRLLEKRETVSIAALPLSRVEDGHDDLVAEVAATIDIEVFGRSLPAMAGTTLSYGTWVDGNCVLPAYWIFADWRTPVGKPSATVVIPDHGTCTLRVASEEEARIAVFEDSKRSSASPTSELATPQGVGPEYRTFEGCGLPVRSCAGTNQYADVRARVQEQYTGIHLTSTKATLRWKPTSSRTIQCANAYPMQVYLVYVDLPPVALIAWRPRGINPLRGEYPLGPDQWWRRDCPMSWWAIAWTTSPNVVAQIQTKGAYELRGEAISKPGVSLFLHTSTAKMAMTPTTRQWVDTWTGCGFSGSLGAFRSTACYRESY